MPLSTFDRAQRAVSALCLSFVVACGASPSEDPAADVTDLASNPGTSTLDSLQTSKHAPRPTPSQPTAPGSTSSTQKGKAMHGVNLSGADFGGSVLPGTEGRNYAWPTTSEIDYYLGKGFDTFRIEFLWERIQPSAYGAFAATYAGKLDALVQYATKKGANVVLNPQNFARYYGNTIGSSQVPNAVFADFWKKMAQKYAGNPSVLFNLVNEPHDMPTEQWVSAANAAILAIRSAGATNTIIAPGNGWTGAHSWNSSDYGTSNAVAMLAIDDPANNTLFEVHQYLDAQSGGQSGECVSTTIGSERLAGFVKWLRDNKKKGFVGEFAGGRNATCYAAVTDMVKSMSKNADVLEGWVWWAGGPWWGDYQFTLEPSGGTDRPQMGLLTPYL